MSTEEGTPFDRIRFFHRRSNHFRVVRGDVVRGALTPSTRCISVEISSEVMELPESVTREILPDGELGKIVARTGNESEGLVRREIEVELILTADVARYMVRFLQNHLAMLDQIESGQPDETLEEGS